jgi:hypothetical protein
MTAPTPDAEMELELDDDREEEGEEMDLEEAMRLQARLESLDAVENTQSEDRARQAGIEWAEILYALLLYTGTDEKVAEDEYNGFCARIAVGDYPLGSDVDVLQAKVDSLLSVAESILTEGRYPAKLDMRLYTVLRTAAQVFSTGSRQREYGAEVKSPDLQLNSQLLDLVVRDPIATGDYDAYHMADFIDERFLRKGRDGLARLAGMFRQEKLNLLCGAREALAGYMNMDVVPGMLDGQMLNGAHALCFDLFGDGGHSYGHSSIAPLYFSSASNRDALRRTLYSMCALAGMSRSGMLVECFYQTRKGGIDDSVAYARLGSSHEWQETESLIGAIREVFAARRAAHTLTTDTNASISAFCRAFADWFDGCTHDDARFQALMRAFSASCVTIGKVPAGLRALWDVYTATAGVRCLCLWGAAEFLCSAALSLKGIVLPLHVGYMCALSGAIGASCHRGINGPMVFTPAASVMIRQVYSEIGDLAVADARATDKVPKYTPGVCGYSIPIRDMIKENAVRLQNNKTALTECHVRACLVHLSRTEGWRSLVAGFGRSLACIPSERNKQGRRIFMRAIMAGPFVAGSDCFHPSGQHFLASQRDAEHAYKYNDIMGGALVVAIFYPIASKALKEAVHVKFLAAHSAVEAAEEGRKEEVKKQFTHPTVECLDEFLRQLSDLAAVVFDPQTRLQRADKAKAPRILHRAWAELVFRQQLCFIQSFSDAVRGAPTVFSRICNATGSHAQRPDDDPCEATEAARDEAGCSPEEKMDADFAASRDSLFA